AADPSCPRCRRTFSQQPDYLDLTLTSGLEPAVYNQKAWGGTELFRSPLISYVYERGWRQGFLWAGFPGVDKEFARSGCFSGIVAADFSESMLQQAKTFFQAALAEISRVLAPGGVFVGTTFMLDKRLAGPYKWWEEAELRDLSASVGLQVPLG
ncbi:predicted protein, partial [Haematococcus lacustris]